MTDPAAAPAPSSPAALAGQLVAGGQPGPPGAPAVKKYPSPSQFAGHPWAVDINRMLDSLDKPEDPASALFTAPASKFKVGECAMATAATFSTPDMNIHPAWLLALSLCAYATVVVVHRLDKKDAAKGDGSSAPAEGNRFASRP